MTESKINQISNLVNDIVSLMVEDSSSVKVSSSMDAVREITIMIECNKTDVGRLIGLNGKNIKSIRILIQSMGKRLGYTINLFISHDRLRGKNVF